jgi:energy-coupling factor transporter ATP-binding protein EcfA2
MRLHSLALEHWRSYVEAREFRFDEQPIQILHGPNGSGKSTLSAAIHAAFFLGHKSSAAAALALQPWGKTLAPKVTVEFSIGPRRFRLVKQYLQGRQALLMEQLPSGWTLLASHEAAEEQLAALLDLDASKAAVLWARQGDLALPVAGESVRSAVQKSLGLQASSGAALALEKAIDAEYAKYFTPGGKLKSGSAEPALPRLAREVKDLEQQALQAQEALAGLEKAQQDLADSTSNNAALEAQLATAQATWRAADAMEQKFQSWQQRKAPLEPELRQRELQLSNLLKDEKAARELRQQHEQLSAKCQSLEQVPAAESDLDTRIATLEAPTPEQLQRWTKLQSDCQLVEAKINAARVEVILRPSGEAERLILGDPNVDVALPGYGSIEARIPNAGGKELAAERSTLRAQHPVDLDLADLNRRVSEARKLSTQLEQLRQQRQSLLASTRHLLEDKGRQLAEMTPVDASRRDQLLAEIHVWQDKLKVLGEEGAQFPPDPRAARMQAQQQVEQLTQQIAKLRENQAGLRQAIESALALSPYQNSNAIAERLALTKLDHERERIRVDAIQVLRETLLEERQSLLGRYTEPVAERAALLLDRLAGQHWGRVQIGEDLRPGPFQPPAMPQGVSLKELSGGEGEQVHLAVRLALAGLLAAQEPQLVLLDDVLTATDQARLERLLQYLQTQEAQLQILILTCHPERFSTLQDKANWTALHS